MTHAQNIVVKLLIMYYSFFSVSQNYVENVLFILYSIIVLTAMLCF